MKEKKEKKLRLERISIQDLNMVLDSDQKNAVKGGSINNMYGLTNIPVVCIP